MLAPIPSPAPWPLVRWPQSCCPGPRTLTRSCSSARVLFPRPPRPPPRPPVLAPPPRPSPRPPALLLSPPPRTPVPAPRPRPRPPRPGLLPRPPAPRPAPRTPVLGHYRDPAFGDVVSVGAVGVQVKPDDARLRYFRACIHDSAPDTAVPPDF